LRQLASGRVPVAVALALMAALLVAAAATIAFAPLPKSFAVTVAIYLAINIRLLARHQARFSDRAGAG